MTEKDLRSIKKYEIRKRHLTELIQKLEQEARQIGASRPNPDRVQTDGDPQRMETIICDMAEAKARLEKLIVKTEQRREQVVNKIHKLEDIRHIQVLYEKYVNLDIDKDYTVREKSFKAIGEKIGYSEAQTWRLHDEAIKAFRKIR